MRNEKERLMRVIEEKESQLIIRQEKIERLEKDINEAKEKALRLKQKLLIPSRRSQGKLKNDEVELLKSFESFLNE